MNSIRVGVLGFGLWLLTVAGVQASVAVDRYTPFQAFLFSEQGMTAPAGDEIWIDRETLAYYLRDVLNSDRGREFRYFLDQCDGVKLVKKPWGTQVRVHFASAITFQFNTQKGAKKWELYGFYLPQTWEFSVSIRDGKASVWGLDRKDSLELWAKVPWGPDTVLIRSVDGDLTNGQVDIHLGAFWNSVSVVASARILDREFDGVDVWESIKANFWGILSPVAGLPIRR